MMTPNAKISTPKPYACHESAGKAKKGDFGFRQEWNVRVVF